MPPPINDDRRYISAIVSQRELQELNWMTRWHQDQDEYSPRVSRSAIVRMAINRLYEALNNAKKGKPTARLP
jgi:hypothetical protein